MPVDTIAWVHVPRHIAQVIRIDQEHRMARPSPTQYIRLAPLPCRIAARCVEIRDAII